MNKVHNVMWRNEVKGRVRRSYARSVGIGSEDPESTGFGCEMKFDGNNYDTVTCRDA